MRLVLAALLAASPAAASLAHAATQHDVGIVLTPESGAIAVTHRLAVSGGTAVTVVLPDRMTVRQATINGRPVTGSLEGRTMEVEPGAGGSAEVVLASDASPWPGTESRGPFIGPKRAFLPGGSGWLAAVDDAEQVYRLSVEVPLPYKAVATGRLLAEAEENGLYRARFQTETPMEPPTLFAGRYVVGEQIRGDLRLRTYFPAERTALSLTYLEAAASYIDRFSRQIGPYPFAGFSIVAAPQPVGLGFPGLTYVSERILPLPFMRGRSLAHEVAHNWWGNGVGVDYATGNWAEGLTTFMADYGLAEDAGAAQAGAMRLEWLRDFAALPEERDLALRRFTHKAHDAAQVVGYGKAAFVFVMLRDALGDDSFTAGLRLFWRQARFKTASWDDLRRAFETASGTDLAPFFAQWLDRRGAPSLSLTSAAASADGNGHVVTVRLEQAMPGYRLSVPLRVETDDGVSVHRVETTGAETVSRLTVAGRPRSVSLDPDHALFRRLAPGEAPPILRDVTLAGNSAVLIAVGADAAAEAAARALAGRLVDGDAGAVADTADRPVLLIALDATLRQALDSIGAGPVPAALDGRGSARLDIALTERNRGAGRRRARRARPGSTGRTVAALQETEFPGIRRPAGRRPRCLAGRRAGTYPRIPVEARPETTPLLDNDGRHPPQFRKHRLRLRRAVDPHGLDHTAQGHDRPRFKGFAAGAQMVGEPDQRFDRVAQDVAAESAPRFDAVDQQPALHAADIRYGVRADRRPGHAGGMKEVVRNQCRRAEACIVLVTVLNDFQ